MALCITNRIGNVLLECIVLSLPVKTDDKQGDLNYQYLDKKGDTFHVYNP